MQTPHPSCDPVAWEFILSKFRPSAFPVAVPVKPNPRVASTFANPAFAQAPAQIQAPGPQAPSVAQEYNPFRRIALLIGCLYILILFSFLNEILIIRFGITVYLPIVIGVPTVLAYFFTGGLVRTLSFRPVQFYLCFALCLLASAALSSWPGGSYPVLSGFFRTQWIPMFLLTGLVYTWKDYRTAIVAVTLGGLINILTAQYMSSEDSTGRLELDIVTLGNSNDLAAQLLMIIPLFWAITGFNTIPKVFRWTMYAAIGASLIVVLRTGSRGALLALIFGYLFSILRASGKKRFAVAILAPILAFSLLIFIPGVVADRLATLFSEKDANSEAAQSGAGRKEILYKAIGISFQKPLFGVGPGQFGNFEGAQSKALGKQAHWNVPHNSYVQVASEVGYPALFFMLGSLLLGFKIAFNVQNEARRRGHKELEHVAFTVMASMLCFSVAAFFLTLSFRFYFPFLVGLSASLGAVARHEFNRLAKLSVPALPRIPHFPYSAGLLPRTSANRVS